MTPLTIAGIVSKDFPTLLYKRPVVLPTTSMLAYQIALHAHAV